MDNVDCRLRDQVHNITEIFSGNMGDNSWENNAYKVTRDAVIRFPMQSFCKWLFGHSTGCKEFHFLIIFFGMLYKQVCDFLYQIF